MTLYPIARGRDWQDDLARVDGQAGAEGARDVSLAIDPQRFRQGLLELRDASVGDGRSGNVERT